VRTFVSPEAAHALEQHVGRREIRDNEVQINVHALFHHLGGSEDAAEGIDRTVPPEAFKPIFFQFGTTLKGKPAVQKPDANGAFAHSTGHGTKGVLRFNDGIAFLAMPNLRDAGGLSFKVQKALGEGGAALLRRG
jgi:hypothetical protein